MSRQKKDKTPPARILQAMRDWRLANAMFLRARGPLEKEHWRQRMVEAAERMK